MVSDSGPAGRVRRAGALQLSITGRFPLISEFELGVLRARMHDARSSKAARGELRIGVPVGYVWDRDTGLGLDPDKRVQETVRQIFARFRALGSARQVLLALTAEQLCFPRPSDGSTMVSFDWTPIRYGNVISVLKNPFYAGAYAYGKNESRTEIVDGHVRKTYGHAKPMEEWEVLLKDHHESYIDWAEFERNQAQLAANAFGWAGGAKSGRGGRALLSGLLSCGRCGRTLSVAYAGRSPGNPVYFCNRRQLQLGLERCLRFGGARVDAAIADEILRVVEPLAVEASLKAGRAHVEGLSEQQRVAELDLQQARYEASLAERRYAACDPDNRLIAAELEKSWEVALRRVQACEARLEAMRSPSPQPSAPDLAGLADDLKAAWSAPGVSMRARQRLVRTLISGIVADVDEEAREVLLTIHWVGGRHSRLRVRKPRSGEHGCRTPEEALGVIRSMAGRWSDEHIAASLNRMGMRTGQDKSWTGKRVGSIRRVNGIDGYLSADKQGDWCTMTEAANEVGTTSHTLRRLIEDGTLPATQLVPRAPWQIRAADLHSESVAHALAQRKGPRRASCRDQMSMFSDT